jgi:hypothetical protein
MAERSIVDIGKYLQRYGLRVGENPAFGGVGGGHSPTGYHPKGLAIDVTDWRPDVAPAYEGGKPIPWKQRTGELSWRAKQLGLFSEALGPGDPGHDTHVHLALEGKKYITDPQLEWLATGRYKTPEGKLTDVMPGSTDRPSTQLPVTEGEGQEDLLTLGLLNLLQSSIKKPKTFEESMTENMLGELLSPAESPAKMFLQSYISSPLPFEA